jgi:DNA-directed RNA polymerase specialized sigma24 family protein
MRVRFTVELSEDLDLKANGAARIAEVEALLDRLSSIDPQLRTIVEMRVFAGFSIPDIAARLNCGERTVGRCKSNMQIAWRSRPHGSLEPQATDRPNSR